MIQGSGRSSASARAVPPVVSIIGRKNSGKTTMLVALVAELKRRGHRIATVKHGHPHFEVDQPGSDSWRHMHEGGADAVVIASSAKVSLIERRDGEPDPEAMIARLLRGRGYDFVLVEGYKRGPFPKVEVFRRAVHDRPIHDPREAHAAGVIAVVTDDSSLQADCAVITLGPGGTEPDGAPGADADGPGAAAPASSAAATAGLAASDGASARTPPDHAAGPAAPGHVVSLADLLEERLLKVRA